MANNSTDVTKTEKAKKYGASTASLKEIALVCLSKWYWFVISAVVALSIAILYIAMTPPIYNATSCLIIKQDRRGGSTGADATSSNFSNMGKLFTQNSNVHNEMLAFESPELMEEVARRLDLRAVYTVPHHMYRQTLYGPNLPVEVSPIDFPENNWMQLSIRYHDRESVELYNMCTFIAGKKVVYGESILANFLDTTDTPVGRVIVKPTMSFIDTNVKFNDIRMDYTTLAQAAAGASSGFKVSLTDKEATAITLSKSDRSLARAKDILGELIAVYNDTWVDDQNKIAISTSKFINERLKVIEGELGDVDSSISEFKSRNQLLDPFQTGSMYITQAGQLQTELNEMNNRCEMAKMVRESLLSSARNSLIPANLGIDNAPIEEQIAEFNSKQLERNRLVASSSEDHPHVISLDQELAGMRGNIVVSIDSYISFLDTRIRSLQREESSNAAKISMSPLQAEYLTDIERQQKVKASLYEYLLQKREENELSQAFTAYNTRVLTPPTGSPSPVAPKRARILLIALLVGLAFPAIWIYFSESSNTTIRGRKDVEDLSIPFVGEIPEAAPRKRRFPLLRRFRKKEEVDEMAVVKAHNRDVINEAFRVARSNVEFMCDEPGCKVFMTTSYNIGSGKSFCTLNLAIALALKDKRVCVVDLDLRKRTISRYLKAPKHGISEYLSSRVSDMESIIMKGVITPTLDFLPAGLIPPNPTELLYSENMSNMMAGLKEHYDYVLIDCPPVDIVADASIISGHADHTVFVVRAGLLSRSMLPVLDKLYDQKRYNGMMLLLNGTDVNSLGRYSRYGYNYGYRYVYRYGYGRHGKHSHGAYYSSAYGDESKDVLPDDKKTA